MANYTLTRTCICVRIHKPTTHRIIIPTLQIIQPRIPIVPIPSVPERVDRRNRIRCLAHRCSGSVGHAGGVSVRVIAVSGRQNVGCAVSVSFLLVDPYHISLDILFKVIVGPSRRIRILHPKAHWVVALIVQIPQRVLHASAGIYRLSATARPSMI